MSAFLGKIHYWLYNKIQVHENLIEEVKEAAEIKGYNTDELINSSCLKYGFPIKGSLENEIDNSNIHGWLQDRIVSVERRMAYIITGLMRENILTLDDIKGVFYQNAVKTMIELSINQGSPQDFFGLVFDFMLEGMPCDRVNQIVENSDSNIIWKTTRCLHKAYWDEVGGDIKAYYLLRDSWINGFLNSSTAGYGYTRNEDGLCTIGRA